MKAIIRQVNKDGSTNLGTGTNYVTKEYKSIQTLLRYGVPETWKNKPLNVEIYTG